MLTILEPKYQHVETIGEVKIFKNIAIEYSQTKIIITRTQIRDERPDFILIIHPTNNRLI